MVGEISTPQHSEKWNAMARVSRPTPQPKSRAGELKSSCRPRVRTHSRTFSISRLPVAKNSSLLHLLFCFLGSVQMAHKASACTNPSQFRCNSSSDFIRGVALLYGTQSRSYRNG